MAHDLKSEAAEPFDPDVADSAAGSTRSLPAFPIDLPTFIREIEERCIMAALERTNGNKKAAADLLGLGRTTLVEKLRRHREHRLRKLGGSDQSDGLDDRDE